MQWRILPEVSSLTNVITWLIGQVVWNEKDLHHRAWDKKACTIYMSWDIAYDLKLKIYSWRGVRFRFFWGNYRESAHSQVELSCRNKHCRAIITGTLLISDHFNQLRSPSQNNQSGCDKQFTTSNFWHHSANTRQTTQSGDMILTLHQPRVTRVDLSRILLWQWCKKPLSCGSETDWLQPKTVQTWPD